MDKTFTAFKQDFYSRIKDFSLFDSGELNLLKVVLDGLKVDYVSKGKIRIFILQPFFVINLFSFFNRIRMFFGMSDRPVKKDFVAELRKTAKRKFLIIDPGGRTVKTANGIVSFYFGEILKTIGRENAVIIAEGRKKDIPEHDLRVSDYNVFLFSSCGSLKKEDKEQLRILRSAYSRITATGIFSPSEMENILVAFQQFFIQYVFWKNLLNAIQPDKVLLWPHYHREGCIAALQENKIRVIELQHGLIASEDIFYVLPETVRPFEKKMLFADEIWVYGQFWKDQLLKGAGYDESRIKTVGYYPVTLKPSEETKAAYREIFPEKKIILITTQTFMHDYFCAYIKYLSHDLISRNAEYGILVKLHPAEAVEKYSTISNLGNVKIVNENLDVLFTVAHLHVSVFSTTLFDALRFNVPNFSFWVEQFSDYIALFREEKISRVIQANENPLDFMETVDRNNSAAYYYEEFKASLLTEVR
ncbi:MAG: hypothetical protein M3R17_12185 [Bacteroidota bacterium]|nr:hypothetical protein [Bacteroidota bacterium]